MDNQKITLKESPVILWRELLDLGIESCLALLRKRKTERAALRELRASLSRQSEEHWQGLYRALKRLK